MIDTIWGRKGSGKTKKIIDIANDAIATTTGNIVFIAANNRYVLDLKHQIRFINASEYDIKGEDGFIGFINGLIAQDFDMHRLFIDGFLKIVKEDVSDLERFFKRLKGITERSDVNITVSISADAAEMPAFMKAFPAL